jgi:hypothetical protein
METGEEGTFRMQIEIRPGAQATLLLALPMVIFECSRNTWGGLFHSPF